jgi:hypothetical protein
MNHYNNILKTEMKPLKIYIEPQNLPFFNEQEIKYVFRTFCKIMGIPWHFIHSVSDNEYVDIAYSKNPVQQARLQIYPTQKTAYWSEIELIKDSGLVLFNFDKDNSKTILIKSESGKTTLELDIIYAAFYILTGKFEAGIVKDKWDRHEVKDTLLYKEDLLHTPLVDTYIQWVKKLFTQTHEFIPKWPNNAKIALALSHDTDYPDMIKGIETLRFAYQKKKIDLKKTFEILSGKESFWRFEEWVKIEKDFGFKSAFYMCSFKGNLPRYFLIAPDTFYNINNNKYKQVAKFLIKEGWEIGLHSSFNAFKSEDVFRKEKKKLENTFEIEVAGNRHHYWHLNQDKPYETALIHQNIGLKYDTSVVFEKHSGFRYGICSPFQLFHVEKKSSLDILQLPPTLMDDHLFGYAKNAKFGSYQEHIDSLLNAVYDNEGIFVTDYHVRVLNDTFFPDWGNSIKYLMQNISDKGGYYNATPKEIAQHWKVRINLIERESKE